MESEKLPARLIESCVCIAIIIYIYIETITASLYIRAARPLIYSPVATLISGTSGKGSSEKRTASLERTVCSNVPKLSFPIHF